MKNDLPNLRGEQKSWFGKVTRWSRAQADPRETRKRWGEIWPDLEQVYTAEPNPRRLYAQTGKAKELRHHRWGTGGLCKVHELLLAQGTTKVLHRASDFALWIVPL